jgi:predicted  nucleic acid-binding Zn-ribbon protein
LLEELKLLMQLQEIDNHLQELQESRGDLPEVVERLRHERDDNQSLLSQRKNELQEQRKFRTEAEDRLSMAKENLKKYEKQLYNVANNREYDAISAEIEAVKKEISKHEARAMEFIKAEGKTEEMIKELETVIGSINLELGTKEKELIEKLASTEKDELKLHHEREKIEVRLKKQVLSSYERIRKAKGGLAVVPVTREACGGCFKSLPPQKRVEIRKMDKIIYCEACGRILIYDSND